MKYGKWEVIKERHSFVTYGRGKYYKHLCECDCGKRSLVLEINLLKGCSNQCKSCSSIACKTIHGLSQSREYKTWCGMHKRCGNPKDHAFKHYGARGIKVCSRWDKFENFYQDMGKCPKKYSIERIDNDKGYSPENCRWASTTEQAANKRITRRLTLDGITKCLTEWCRHYKISPGTIWYRLTNGLSMEEALTLRVWKGNNLNTFKQKETK